MAGNADSGGEQCSGCGVPDDDTSQAARRENKASRRLCCFYTREYPSRLLCVSYKTVRTVPTRCSPATAACCRAAAGDARLSVRRRHLHMFGRAGRGTGRGQARASTPSSLSHARCVKELQRDAAPHRAAVQCLPERCTPGHLEEPYRVHHQATGCSTGGRHEQLNLPLRSHACEVGLEPAGSSRLGQRGAVSSL